MDISELKKTVREVIPEDWTADRLLRAIGLEMRRNRARTLLPVALAFAGGIVVGGIAALLLAPKSGLELRSDIEDKVDEVKGKARDFVQERRAKKESTVTDESERDPATPQFT